jgi:arsenate reductase
MPIAMYGIRNCDTIKKARAWLEGHKVDYSFHDFKTKDGFTRDDLETWCQALGWEKVFNRGSATFKKLPDAQKEGITKAKAIAMMLEQPSMIKRPVLDLGRGKFLLGFKADEYEKAVKPNGR